MTVQTLDMIQLVGASLALLLQAVALVLVQPMRKLVPKLSWRCLMTLNAFILMRRALSLLEVSFGWNGQGYESATVAIGFLVSIFMLLTVTSLRSHIARERQKAVELALATMDLAKETKKEDSVAYQLALYFIEQRSGIPIVRG